MTPEARYAEVAPYAARMVARLRVPPHQREDALVAAECGLWRAACRWTPEGGLNLRDYAIGQARHAVVEFLRRDNRISRSRWARYQAGEAFAAWELPPLCVDEPDIREGWGAPDDLERLALMGAVRAAVAHLPERMRRIVTMLMDGESWRETAQAVGISQTRLHQVRQQAYAQLRSQLAEWEAR